MAVTLDWYFIFGVKQGCEREKAQVLLQLSTLLIRQQLPQPGILFVEFTLNIIV